MRTEVTGVFHRANYCGKFSLLGLQKPYLYKTSYTRDTVHCNTLSQSLCYS